MMHSYDYVTGVDVARETLAFSVYDGRVHHSEEIPYDPVHVFESLIDPYEKRRVLYLCESTGVYHQPIVAWLQERGKEISVVNPFVIRKFAEMRMSRAKTDAVDSRLIAEYGETHAQRFVIADSYRRKEIEITRQSKSSKIFRII